MVGQFREVLLYIYYVIYYVNINNGSPLMFLSARLNLIIFAVEREISPSRLLLAHCEQTVTMPTYKLALH